MENRKVLEKFLLDIHDLNELKKFTEEINIFDVLKIVNSELKHSIVLSYILNPNENHNLGSEALELLFRKLSLDSKISHLGIFDLLDINYDDFIVMREYKNIDILIKSDKNKMLLCIENKIWTSEHNNQLNRYKEIIEKEFSNYKKIYLYLTPFGSLSSDSETWFNIEYSDILEIIEDLKLENVDEKIKILIRDYILIVRRKIMNDHELKELCNKIYRKHKEALDLIWENKDNETYYLYNILEKYLKEKHESGIFCYDESNSSKTYLRFTTPELNSRFPLLENHSSSWKNKNTVFYEIIIGKSQVKVQLSFGYKGLNRIERYNEAKEYLNDLGYEIGEYKDSSGYLVKSFNGAINIEGITLDESEDSKYIFSELDKVLSPILKNR